MDESAFTRIFSAASGVWALVLVNAVALFKAWPLIMARVNERRRDAADEKAGDWSRLRDEIKRLDERIDTLIRRCDELQHEVDACREREHEWMRRAIAAEAAHLGTGDAKQQAAAIVAAERIVQSIRSKNPKGGEK